MRSTPWQPSLSSTDVLDRIKNLTLDLQAIQDELCRELALPDGTPKSNSLSPGLHSGLGVLRTALDQFRRVLWYYVDQTGQTINAEEQNLPQAQQLQPQHLQPKTVAPPAAKLQGRERRPAQSQPTVSFFDRLEMVVEGYLQPGRPLSAFRKPPES
jgi:hypothetical protein